ncbi:MAG: GTP-binding protein [Candidatus Methanomethylophilaceae archaeon]|nr:GTP-binding protein [Candidatus Methanomethylophilaceae archaeon]NLF33998.1 GTPase [Thermoplasmatales archaeon]
MNVYILGGFLGSGKTTLLMRIASAYSAKGSRVAIVVNEMGEIGVDGATLKSEGYDSVELPNGCICCSLSGTLQNALRSIKKDVDPDVIIIEPTGLALPHKVAELVHISMIEPDTTSVIGIADIQRFDDLITKKEEFFKRQMFSADVILINKSDIAEPSKMEAAISWVKKEYPDTPIIPVSAKTGENLDKFFERMA